MLHPVTFRTLALAACTLLAGNAVGLTLGQPRGAVLVGRPLNVAIPLTLDTADGDGACSTAELFYGETAVGTPPTVRWEPSPGGRQGLLRIQSPAPVDEPSVTLSVRVGCGASVASRRYTLLSDVPPPNEPALPLAAPRQATPQALPQAPGAGEQQAAAPAPARASAAARPPGQAAARAPVAQDAGPRPVRGDSRRRAAPAVADPSLAPTTASRLRLAPLEIGPERDPVLHFSSQLTIPSTDPAARAAAAALWQALARTPEEMMQDGLKLQALERDIQSLRQLTQQNTAAVTTMREQVQKARGDRNQVSTLALALLALLLAAAAWLGWRWYQARRLAGVGRWFEANHRDPDDSVLPPAAPPPTVPPPVARVPVRPVAPQASLARPATAAASVHPHLATAPLDVAAARAAIAGWRPSETAEFQPSAGGTLRMVGVRELLDVHDKADFFLSIGQHDQAIAVLEAHIDDQVETSALAWLDLLELYHSLGRRAEFEARRAAFRQRFTAQVPDFDHFDQPGSSLENYSRALSRIVALWPSRRVLEVIEESIFRKPGLPGADVFSLEAYRELVLLYHIAQEVAPPEDADTLAASVLHPDFTATSLQSLSELDQPDLQLDVPLDLDDLAPPPTEQASAIDTRAIGVSLPPSGEGDIAWGDPYAAERDPLLIPPASPRLGLDIDLTASELPDDDLTAAEPRALALPDLLTDGPARASGRELPPLDFDTSDFDVDSPTQEPKPR